MAAIIAQLTLANRERKKRALKHIHNTKCNYTLPPFDPNGFDPKVHNRYIMERERYRVMCVQNEEEEKVLQDIYKAYMVRKLQMACFSPLYQFKVEKHDNKLGLSCTKLSSS